MAELYRDRLGVPHIRAGDLHDLAFAQGEVTARDRGWQIEVDRLRSLGRLAELIGDAGIAWDVFARRARLDDTARRALDALDPETRGFVAAYTAGVRSGMIEGGQATEFTQLDDLFGDRHPLEPWSEHSPLGVLHVAHALFSSFPLLLWREHVAVTLGDEWVDIFAGYGDGGDQTLPTSGSNAWALHGSRTRSGRPILAGDPHRIFELPGVYQQVRLACDEFDVVGLAFPGVPGVAHFGHTGDAAWGVTNAIAHSVDVFRERLRRTDTGYDALGPAGWRPADVERSIVAVRGGAAVPVDAIETERGTIVTDLQASADELIGYSVRMPVRARFDLGAEALLPLLRARTADDVLAAMSAWVDPVNRVLAADRDGEVRSATVGVWPVRRRDERRIPLRGDIDATAGWNDSPVPIRVADITVDANERPDRREIDLGWAYPAPHRANRIRELLDDSARLGVDDLAPVWADTLSGSAESLLTFLPRGDLAPAASTVREILLAWDGRMDADSRGAGCFAAWRSALVDRVRGHPVLAPLDAPHGLGAIFEPWMSVTAHVAAALPRLLSHPAFREDARSIIVEALDAAYSAGAWGQTHRMLPLHVFADVPGASDLGAELDIALAGDGDTVRCTGSIPGATDRSWRGSVARWAWDLADRERSLWSVPFGASGDPASPHFADQLSDWASVDPTPIETDWSRLRRDSASHPQGGPA